MSEPLSPATLTPQLSPLKRAFLALEEAQQRVRELEAGRPEPIAIIGLGCRIPGAEQGPSDFWHLLRSGTDAISALVQERLSRSHGAAELPASALRAGLLGAVDLFDPRHFGISPKEAVGMDPQQRLLLEVSWEALEHAAIDPASLYQSHTGVYLGLASHDYAQLQLQAAGGQGALNPHSASGAAASVAAGRLSYFYGLNGPSIAIDTACSSSLVALHLACEALRHGDCTAALAGGVNLILSPEPSIAFAQAGMLSPSGRVRAFDAAADGFVRGEGCGVVVLKRLSDAERAGDRILAVVLGSAVNQDGASSGLTVPNGLAQQALLREAHRRAGVEPWQVGYVEAHGTGTALGDPIEAEALGAVFGMGTKRSAKLLLGSVKTNIGHLESAAGIAGLIKVVLSLEHGVLPPQLHFERPSEHLRWEELPLEIVTATRAWEPIAGRRIAGVSSFGFSGTNAHVVLEGWLKAAVMPELPSENVLVLSARTARALRDLAGRYAAMLVESESAWSAICYTAAIGRAVFAERLAVVAASREEAAEKLRLWVESEAEDAGLRCGHVSAGKRWNAEALGAAASCEEVAAGFVAGELVDWAGRFEGSVAGAKPMRVALPSYPFERERYWMEASTVAPDRLPGEQTGGGMLGRRLRSAGLRGHFEATLDGEGWVGEHRVEGRVVLPATGHLELMLEAAAEVFGSTASVMLEDVVFEAPLVVEGRRLVQVVVEEESAGRSRVRVYAEAPEEAKWPRVSEGWLVKRPTAQAAASLDLEALRRRLTVAVAGEPFLAGLAKRGLEFGPSFRGLTRGWSDEQESLGEVRRTVAAGDGWQLEPWWLDACLQAAALAGKQSGGEALYLPLSLKRLEIYAHRDARTDMATTTWSHVVLQSLDAQTLTAEITIAGQHGETIARMTGLRFRKLSAKKTADSLLYEVAWEAKERPEDAQRLEVARIAEMWTNRLERLACSELLKQYDSFFAALEELAAEYVVQCFASFAWPQARDQGWSTEQLADLWRVMPRHRRLLNRMVEIAVETGAVRRSARGLRFGDVPQPISANHLSDLRARFPLQQAELDLVIRCGQALPSVLTGALSGHELVFPAGQSEQMAALYADSVPARIFNEMVAETISSLCGPRGGVYASILEVGAGTGATTGYVLDGLRAAGTLPERYLFTDISPLLVRRARHRFGDLPFFASEVFDLNASPGSQGIAGTYSVILAVNVLHATSDLPATLARLRSLLAADGVLIAVEVTGKQRWADITVGLLEGWWSFDDAVRTDYPALPSGAWSAVLEANGFQSVVTIPSAAPAGSVFDRQELLMAQAAGSIRRVLVVDGDLSAEGNFAPLVAARLRENGVKVDLVAASQLSQWLCTSQVPDCVLWTAPRGAEAADMTEVDPCRATESSYRSLLKTAQALIAFGGKRPPRLYVVTHGTFTAGPSREQLQLWQAAIAGMAAGIAMEAPELRCTRIDCSQLLDDSDAEFVCCEILSDSEETWLGNRSGQRYVARLRRLPGDIPARPRELLQSTPGGGIDSLEYVRAKETTLAPDEVEIEVHATSLNFRDVLQTMGAVDLNAALGTDCAGVILRVGSAVRSFAPGDAVVAIAPGAFGSPVVASTAMVARKPEELPFAEAAAQAMAYLTAYFALHQAGSMRRGDRVLIHAAAGGVGLAAVYLCMQVGAVPVVTAGSERKRTHLRQLGVEEVFDSRSCNFEAEVGRPVDIVLNSLAGDAVDAGLRLLKQGGSFLELGKTDLRDPRSVAAIHPTIEYIPIDLTPAFASSSPWVGERLAQLLGEVASGSLPALPIQVFASPEVRQAFRFMARAEHIGRVVVGRRASAWITGTHLVTGGMRGVGLELATFLAKQGASTLVLVGRSKASEEARQRIAAIEATGTTVKLLMGDIGDIHVAGRAVELAGPKLRGVWHCAGMLANASLRDQTWETFRSVTRAKIDGAWNLHRLTLQTTFKGTLDHFVLFSSWASIAGSTGQANHCAVNTYLDALAQQRRLDGLPGLSLNWGAWAESGAAASGEVQRQLGRAGMAGMASKDALSAMQRAIASDLPQVGVAAIDWPRFFAQHSEARENPLYQSIVEGTVQPFGNAAPLEPTIATKLAKETSSAPAGPDLESMAALPEAVRKAALGRIAAELVRKTLDLKPAEAIDPDLPLANLGMDSLLAIELRNRLNLSLKLQLPSTLLFDHPTLRSLESYLYDHAFQESGTPFPLAKLAEPGAPAGPQPGERSGLELLDMIEQMTDQEVESAEIGR